MPRHADESLAFVSRAALAATIMVVTSSCRSDPSSLGRVDEPAIRRTDGYVQLQARIRNEDRKKKDGGDKDKEDEKVFREAVRIDTAGYIYHPRLLEYTAGGLFGLVQSEFDSEIAGDKRSSSDDGESIEYDLTAELLNTSKYPLTLFAHRHEDLIPRAFSASEKQELTEAGFLWRYVDEKQPTSLLYTTRELEFDPLGGSSDDRKKNVDELTFQTEYNVDDDLAFDFQYTHQSVDEDPYDIDYDVDDYRVGGKYKFGPESQHFLASDLTYYDQSGSLDLERTEWRNQLELRHSDTLRSWYRAEIEHREQSDLNEVGVDDDEYRLAATLEHRLYESLVTQVGGYVERQEFKDGPDIDRYSGSTRFDYRKRNRWGVLSATYSIEGQETKQDGGNQIISVIDESRTFNDPDPIVIDSEHVREDSIRITDVTGITLYKEKKDYTVDEFASRTEIRRVPTGTIANGQTVLIDYEIRIGGDFDLSTLYQRFGVRQYFPSGITPYYRLEWQDQDVSGDEDFAPDPEDITAHVVGIEFVGAIAQAMAEYEDHDSSIAPFDAVRLGAGYTHRFDSGATAGFHGRWSDVDWGSPEDRRRKYLNLYGTYRHPLTDHLTFESEARYIDEKDDVAGDDEGIGLDFTLEWLYRKTELTITYEIGKFEDEFAKNTNSLLTVNFIRYF